MGGLIGKNTRNTLALLFGALCLILSVLSVEAVMRSELFVKHRNARKLLDNTESNNIGATIPLRAGSSNTLIKNDAPNDGVRLVSLYLSASQRNASNDFGGSTIGFFGSLGTHMAPSPGRVVALVTWGVGGGQQQVFVSVKNGTALTLAASSVKVEVLYNEDPAAVPTPPELSVTALLSYGPRPPVGTFEPATFDVRFDVPEADLQALQVPPFARALTVASDDPALGVQSLRVQFAGGFPSVQLASFRGVANQKVLTVPVPDGATGVEIINEAATPIANGMAMWHLGL